MLTTILAMVTGGIAPFIAKLFTAYQDGKDKAFELDMAKLQAQIAKDTQVLKLEEVQTSASSNEMLARITAQAQSSGVKWVDALNSLVRPIVTYFFFGLFCLIKLTYLFVAVRGVYLGELELKEAITLVWDVETMCLFSGIMAFWFSDRVLKKGG
jgi:ABC-type multidrug transport system fused ATPase/permease subunit